MRLFVLMICIALIQGATLDTDCSESNLAAMESELASVLAETTRLQTALDSLRLEMSTLSAEISVQSRSGGGRGRMEDLLRESRDLANRMSTTDSDLISSRRTQQRLADRLSRCYRRIRIDVLSLVNAGMRERNLEAASEAIARLQTVESRIRELEPLVTSPQRDRYATEDVDLPDDLRDARFLADAMRDLQAKAVRDSTELSRDLESARQTLELKLELGDLMSDAGQSGLAGGGFFEGLDDVAEEVADLRAEVAAGESRLVRLRNAVMFYERQLERMDQQIEYLERQR